MASLLGMVVTATQYFGKRLAEETNATDIPSSIPYTQPTSNPAISYSLAGIVGLFAVGIVIGAIGSSVVSAYRCCVLRRQGYAVSDGGRLDGMDALENGYPPVPLRDMNITRL